MAVPSTALEGAGEQLGKAGERGSLGATFPRLD